MDVQEHSISGTTRRSLTGKIIRTMCLVFLSAGLTADTMEAKEIGILVDRSMSVDQPNRDEAVKLIEGLITGQIDPAIRSKWRLVEDALPENDPEQRDLRNKEISQLRRLTETDAGEPLAAGNPRLLLGEFGDLETVRKLANAEWRQIDANIGTTIERWAAGVTPSDKETHFELARATAAARVGQTQDFYFFVVSDGVEDLVNWSVSDYLDAAKLKDPLSLERGDFRDTAKARNLEMLNAKRRGGEDLTLKGKVRPAYDPKDRETLAKFRKNFSERQVGHFTLRGTELQNFFTSKPGKVPVNVLIYSARPKAGLISARFTTPAGSTPQAPHPISLGASELRWQVELPPGEVDFPGAVTSSGCQLDLAILSAADHNQIGHKPVQGSSTALFEIFPDLPNGDYELRLTVTKGTHKPAQSAAYISVKRSAPTLAFVDDLSNTTELSSARHFDPRLDGDILGKRIAWKWSSDDAATAAPEKLERALSYFEPNETTATSGTGVPVPLSPVTNSLPLGRLLVSDDSRAEPLPIGGTYRLELRAQWSDGSRATATGWFVLPEPKLTILGKKDGIESDKDPRRVAKGDLIKIGNWMHLWKNFSYELTVLRGDGEKWTPLEGSPADWPLKLDNKGTAGATILVEKNFSGILKYEIRFVPDDEKQRDLVELPVAKGYVKSSGVPLLPWILAIMGAVTLAFLGWHLFRKK